ncbi:MAG: hypothetical protein H6732_00500 [Alphaproteobacteria bacterium]|nr:hypothetical protein [Alphaproteobacteria bacterium]
MVAWWSVVVVTALAGEPRVLVDADAVRVLVGAEVAVDEALADLEAHAWSDAARQLHALVEAGGGADLRVLEAIARYEEGDLRQAAEVVRAARAVAPDHPRLRVVEGLVLADQGRGREALGLLEEAARTDDAWSVGHALLTLGLVHADLGAIEAAREVWTQASRLPDVGARAAAQLDTLGRGASADLIAQVVDALRHGRAAQAEALVRTAPVSTRDRLHASIATAMIERTSGRAGTARSRLEQVVREAGAQGLLRERVAARLELADVLVAEGALREAAAVLDEAEAELAGTSFRLRRLDVLAARVRLSLRAEDARAATRALEALQASSDGLVHAQAAARALELEGLVARAAGDAGGALRTLGRARSAWSSLGYLTDAARVAVEEERTAACVDGLEPPRDAQRAALAAAGVPAARLSLVRGEACGLRGATAAALEAFARAVREAEAPGGAEVGAQAAERTRAVLRGLGHGAPAVAALDAEALQQAPALHARWEASRSAYTEGRAHFEARRYAEARGLLAQAARGFAELREEELAATARLAEGWAAYNEGVEAADEAALRLFALARDRGAEAGAADLELLARVAEARTLARAGRDGAAEALRQAATAAEAAGRADLAARCRADLEALR